MMKFLVGFCVLAVVAPAVFAELKCKYSIQNYYKVLIIFSFKNKKKETIKCAFHFMVILYFEKIVI